VPGHCCLGAGAVSFSEENWESQTSRDVGFRDGSFRAYGSTCSLCFDVQNGERVTSDNFFGQTAVLSNQYGVICHPVLCLVMQPSRRGPMPVSMFGFVSAG
jgi:hypothetical protein